MSTRAIQGDLIFDLGMHYALDTKFYLDKGFRVVALEANPKMAAAAETKLAEEVSEQRLQIVTKALWHRPDEEISFYLNPIKDDWSSAFKNWAEKGGHAVEEIAVKTTALAEMFDQFGVPYYIKCDIEGADELFARQLLADTGRPAFVSVEAMSFALLSLLYAAGYDRIQIVNQAFNGYVQPPQPAREGRFADVQFNGHMSGLFGRELDPDKWLSFDIAVENYTDFMRLSLRDPKLAHGWLDFHVTTRDVLARG